MTIDHTHLRLAGDAPSTAFAAHWRIGFVPHDVLADVVERAVLGEEPWLTTVTRLLEVFAAGTAQEEPFPSSVDALSARFGVAPVPDPRATLLVSLHHRAATIGLAEPRLRSQVV